MLTTADLIKHFELRGRTPRDRCAELFIRSVFDRLVQSLMAETFAAELVPGRRGNSTLDDFDIGDRITFAGKTLRDCHMEWSREEDDAEDQDGIGFFQSLVRATAADIRSRMSPDVGAFWASQGLLEDGGFMRYLAPSIEAIRQLMDENGGAGAAAQR